MNIAEIPHVFRNNV